MFNNFLNFFAIFLFFFFSANKRVIFDLKKNKLQGIPDGMTIDTNGNLWVATFNGSKVQKSNPKIKTKKLKLKTLKNLKNYNQRHKICFKNYKQNIKKL